MFKFKHEPLSKSKRGVKVKHETMLSLTESSSSLDSEQELENIFKAYNIQFSDVKHVALHK